MARTMHYTILLLAALLACACGAPTTNRVQDRDPVKCIWVQNSRGRSGAKRLAIINDQIRPETDPSHLRKGEVSRLTNKGMKFFIIELEGKGFFEVARPSPPSGAKKYISLHLPDRDYYVGLSKELKMAQAYSDAVKAFTAYWTYGDTRFMTGSSTGEAPVDFEQQRNDLLRSNQEQRNKKR